jgi:ABC-type Zn uptake system ZnuABC Zn-binding protein ZnuA
MLLQGMVLSGIAAAVLIASALLIAYNQNLEVVNRAESSQTKPIVVTSIAPIANIIKNVGGDRIDIISIVPSSEDSHTFIPSVTDEVIIKTKADLVIINGLGLETAIEAAAKQSENSQLRLLKLGDRTVSREQWEFDNSFPESGGIANPHLWLNVQYAMKYAELVRDELSLADPENAEYYDANTELYLAQLRQLDDTIMTAVATIPEENRKLVTYHDSFPYFAKRYGFEVVAALQPAHFGEPTESEIAGIVAQIRTENVPAIFASEVFPNGVTQRIAEEANVEVVRTLRDDVLPGEIGASQNTYVGMMVSNVRTTVAALGGDPTALEEIDPSNTFQKWTGS